MKRRSSIWYSRQKINRCFNALFAFLTFAFVFVHGTEWAHAFSASKIGDQGNVMVMTINGNYDADEISGSEPRRIVSNTFYETRQDDFDFLVIFTDFDFVMPEAEALAFYQGVKNDVTGIGKEPFDNTAFYGSAGKLQGTIDMGNLSKWSSDPLDPDFSKTMRILSHEFIHRWSAFIQYKKPDGTLSKALLGKDETHWSFLLDLEGTIQYGNNWHNNGDGTFTTLSPIEHFSPLDLYLMGLADKSEVLPMLLIENGDFDHTRLPEAGITIAGNEQYVTIDDIIAAEGERLPDRTSSQKKFTLGCIFLTRSNTYNNVQLAEIRRILTQWEVWYSGLTDGRSTVDFFSTPYEAVEQNPGIDDPQLIERTTPPAILEGVAWLVGQQNSDGSWFEKQRFTGRDTALAVHALNGFNSAAGSHALGIEWLQNNDHENTDYLARKIQAFALAGMDAEALIETLISKQNDDGGWGSDDGYASNPMDTALALSALAQIGSDDQSIQPALDYLNASQNSNGSWGAATGSADIQSTAYALSALSTYRHAYNLDSVIQNAIDWLALQQSPNGGFGPTAPTVYETAMALLGLRAYAEAETIRTNAINYLFEQQLQNDSWYNSVYQTALAIQALYAMYQNADLTAFTGDITLTPEKIAQFPCQMTMEALISNRGLAEAVDASIVLYHDVVDEDHIVGRKVVSIAGLSSQIVSFDFTITEGTSHRYFVVADADQSISENVETNNTAMKLIDSAPSFDLSTSSADLVLTPDTVSIDNQMLITTRVYNHGTRDAFHVPVRFYIDDNGTAYEIATLNETIPSNGYKQISYTWKAAKIGADQQLRVQVDPLNAFEEFNEANNSASAILTVLPHHLPNVAVSFSTITFEPEPALQAGPAVVNAVVTNNGGADAVDVLVQCGYHQSGQSSTPFDSVSIATLPSGASESVSFTWNTIPVSGDWLIDVIADPANLIEEYNETDNHAFKSLTILNLPEFIIGLGSITISPSVPADGDMVTIGVEIQNTGEQSGLNVPVTFYEGSTQLGSNTISIPALSQATTHFTYDTTGRSGMHTITIAVNPTGAILEQNSGNNTASKSFGVQNSDLWVDNPYMATGRNQGTSFFFRLQDATDVTVCVVDAYGRTVRTFNGPELENTSGTTIYWDGRDDNGKLVPDGVYTIQAMGSGGQILASLSVTVDNNLSSLADAMGTKYLALKNITCYLPEIEYEQWLPDESGIVFMVRDKSENTQNYPPGLYSIAPGGGDIIKIYEHQWPEENKPHDYYTHARIVLNSKDSYFLISPTSKHVAFIVPEYLSDFETIRERQLWIASPYGENLQMVDAFPNADEDGLLDHRESLGSEIYWSSDGQYLAYTVGVTGGRELRIRSVAGGVHQVVPVEDYFAGDSIQWNKHRTVLLYREYDYTAHQGVIKTFDISGNLQVYHSEDPNESYHDPYWLDSRRFVVSNGDNFVLIDTSQPDKRWLFDNLKDIESYRSFTVNPAGGGFAVIVRDSADGTGDDNYYGGYNGWEEEDGYWRVVICQADGSCTTVHQAKYITDGPFYDSLEQMVWNHQGDKLAFVDYAYEQVDQCIYHGHIVTYDLKTQTKASYRILPDNSICEEAPDEEPESYHIMTYSQGAWVEKDVLHYGSAFTTQNTPIDQWQAFEQDGLRLRIFHKGTDYAQIDAIWLSINEELYFPAGAINVDTGEDILGRVVSANDNAADVAAATIEYTWTGLPIDAGRVVLNMRAREYSTLPDAPDDVTQSTDTAATLGSHPLNQYGLKWLYDGVWLMAGDIEGFYYINTYTNERKDLNIDEASLAGFGITNYDFIVENGNVRVEEQYWPYETFSLPKAKSYLAGLGFEDGRWEIDYISGSSLNNYENIDVAGYYAFLSAYEPAIKVPHVFDFKLSPRSRYLTYGRYHDLESVCADIGITDLWLVRSLLNLTANLNVTKKEDAIYIKGTATDKNFDQWVLEYADVQSPDEWTVIKPPSSEMIVSDDMGFWIPPRPGTYYIRLSVSDLAGNTLEERQRVTWGVSASVADIYLDDAFVSPNGDGAKDQLKLNFTVIEPVNLLFNIYDDQGDLINTLERNYPDVPPETLQEVLVWNGLDQDGNPVPEGNYYIEVLGYEFDFTVDYTPPRVSIYLSNIDQVKKLLPGDYEKCQDDLCRKKFKYMAALLSIYADDAYMENWLIESGDGESPTSWHEIGLAGCSGQASTAQDLLMPAGWSNWSDFANKKYRITAVDQAGNQATVSTEIVEDVLFVPSWQGENQYGKSKENFIAVNNNGDGSIITDKLTAYEPIPTGYLLGDSELLLATMSTVRNVTSYVIQYYDELYETWIDGQEKAATTSGYEFQNRLGGKTRIPFLKAENDFSDAENISKLRIKATNSYGTEYFSNEISTGRSFMSVLDCEYKAYIKVENNLGWEFRSLSVILQRFGHKDTVIKAWDIEKGDQIPYGNFSFNYRLANPEIRSLRIGDRLKLHGISLEGNEKHNIYPVSCGPAVLSGSCGDPPSCGSKPVFDAWFDALGLESITVVHLKENGERIILQKWNESYLEEFDREWIPIKPNNYKSQDKIQLIVVDINGDQYEVEDSINCNKICLRLKCTENIDDAIWPLRIETDYELTGLKVEVEPRGGVRAVDRQWDHYQGDLVPQESFELWDEPGWSKPEIAVGDKIFVTAVDINGQTYETGAYAAEGKCGSNAIGELKIGYKTQCNEMRKQADVELEGIYNKKNILKADLYVEQNGERTLLYEHQFQDEETFTYELDLDRIDGDGKYIISSGNIKLVAIYTATDDSTFELQADLYVDRTAPTAVLNMDPAGPQICPALQTLPDGTEALTLDIYGTANDPRDMSEYALYYSTQSEEDGDWSIAKDVNKQAIRGSQNIDGLLGTWRVPDNISDHFSLKLEAKDKADNTSCDIIVFETLPIELQIMEKLFSPNSDGEKDQLHIAIVTEDSYAVDLEIHGSKNGGSENELVKTLLNDQSLTSGAQSIPWDGTNNSGEIVEDGTYGVVMRATDKCGNVTERVVNEITVDNTPPSAAILSPGGDGQILPTIVEITGSVHDLHLSQYRLELYVDTDSDPEEILGGGARSIENVVIGTWNTNGLIGKRVLRLWALDKAANRTVVDLPVELIAKVNVITDFKVDTPYFSPNNDQRLDRAVISYRLNDELGTGFDTRLQIRDSDGNTARDIEMNGLEVPEGQFVWDGTDSQAQALPDGRYTIMLTASLSGYPGTIQNEQINLILDNTLPEIEFASPVEGAFLAEDTAIQGSIADKYIDQYTITIDGEGIHEDVHSDITSHEDHTFGIIDDLPDGVYVLNAQAGDMAQNRASVQVNFTVDRTAPVLNLEAPLEGAFLGGDNGTMVIRGSIEEANLETWRLRYRLKQSGGPWNDLIQGSQLPSDANLFSWNVGSDANIADGEYELSLYAADHAAWQTDVIITVTIDNTAPQAALSSPQEGGYVTTTCAVQGSASDTNLVQYELSYAEGACAEAYKWTPIARSETSVSDGDLAQWRLLPADGNYCLRLIAEDKVGLSATVTRQVAVDTHPPEPPVLSGKVEDLENIHLNWTAVTDPDFREYKVYRDGRQINATLLTENEFADTELSEDTYGYTVTAVDLAGLESAPSNEVVLEIDLTPPSARIRIPAEGDMVSDVVTISGTAFSDDDFKEYRISVGRGVSPASWQLLNSAPLGTTYGQLAQWDCAGLVNGDIYTLKLEAEDIAGNVGTHQVAVTVDTLAPQPPVLISAEPQGPDSGDVDVIWQNNTEPDLAGYLLYRNNELVNVSGTVIGDLSPYLLSGTQYTDLGLADGEHEYYALAMDTTGNLSSPSNTLTASVDTHAPQLSISEPEAGLRFDKPLIVKAVSGDLDIVAVQFQYKAAAGTQWIDLNPALSVRPFVTYLDPETLGLEYGTYQIRAVGTDQGGRTDPDPQTIDIDYADITPPEAPVALTAQAQGDHVALAWSANAETDLSGYHVYLYDFEQSEYVRLTSAALTQPDFIHSEADGLSDGLYLYRVTAEDAGGNESVRSDRAYATIYTPRVDQPYTPLSENTVEVIGWVQPMHTVTIFSDTGSGPVASGTVEADDQGYFSSELPLQIGENVITVRGVDADGNFSKDSPEVVVVHGVAPQAPTGLEAEVQDGVVNLTWQPNQESDLLGYNVFRDGEKLNAGSLFEGGTAAASTRDYLADNVRDNNTNSYWYFYLDDISPEAWWELDLGSRQLITRVEIDWRENYAGREFVVEGWSGYAWIPLVIARYNESAQNGFDLAPVYATDRIRLRITAGVDDDDRQTAYLTELRLWRANPVTTESYTDQSELNGEFDYHVTAVNDLAMESAPSQSVAVTVGDVTPPPAPSLTASASASSVILNWTTGDPQDTAGYYVYKLLDEQWIRLNAELLTATQLTESNLPNGEYTYRVIAEDAVGNQSDPSNEASALVDIALLPEPVSPTAMSLPEGRSVEVCWEAVPGAAGYKLLRSLTPGGPYEPVTETIITETCFIDADLLNGYQYYYRVLPVDGLGNEGQLSTETSAVPEDLVAPSEPVFLSPGLGNQRVDVSNSEIDIIGWAEPGSLINFYINETYYDNRTTSTRDQYRQWAADLSAEDNVIDWAVSPDGRSLALSFHDASASSYVCRIYDFESNSYESLESMVPTTGRVQALRWSPDGSKLALCIYNENYEVMIYDRAQGEIIQLPQVSGSYHERAPVWDSGGRHLLFVSNRLTGIYEVWSYELASSELLPLTDQAQADSALISPDGRYLAYAVQMDSDDHLYCLDLQAGGAAILVTDRLRVDSDAVPMAAWLADDTGLAYLDGSGAGGDIYLFTPETPANTPLTDDGDILTMTVDPSGTRVAYEKTADDTLGLWILSIPENEFRAIDANTEGNTLEAVVDRLAFTSTGELYCMDETIVHIISPAGRFKAEDVRLEPGENRITAQAVDESGNAGVLSDTLYVDLDADFLPDLEVTSNDLYNFPYVPVQGDTVQFAIVVRNNGMAAAGNVDVRASIWYPDDSMEPVYNNPIEFLAAGEETTIVVEWASSGKSDKCSLLVEIDEYDRIVESSELNNIAFMDFYVAAGEGIHMYTGLEYDLYYADEDVNISVDLNNTRREQEVELTVEILDADHNVVALIAQTAFVLPYTPLESHPYAWNSGEAVAGDYYLHALLEDSNGILEEDLVAFAIEPRIDMVAGIVSDKTHYGPGETVQIHATFMNQGKNVILPQVDAAITITDSEGAEVFTHDRTVHNLIGLTNTAINTQWPTEVSAPGVYTMTMTVSDPSKTLAFVEQTFVVDQVPLLSGAFTLTPGITTAGNLIAGEVQVQNQGNCAASGALISIVVLDQASQQELQVAQVAADIPQGGQFAGTLQFNAPDSEPDTYTVQLRCDTGDGSQVLAEAGLTLQSSTQTPVQIAGTLVAQPDTVIQGEPVQLAYSVTNQSSYELLDLQVTISVPSAHLTLTPATVNVPPGLTVYGQVEVDTSYLITSDYTARIDIKNTLLPEAAELARTLFRVEPVQSHCCSPVALPGGPYIAAVGETIFLDASDSFDPDEGLSESGDPPYDTITEYAWELDMVQPYGFDDALGAEVEMQPYDEPGTYTIALRVTDNSSEAFPGEGMPNLTGTAFTDVVVFAHDFSDFAAHSNYTKCRLTWTHLGADLYEILRSEAGPNSGFEVIGATGSTCSSYLDRPIEMYKDYWYRVRTVIDSQTVLSDAVYVYSVRRPCNNHGKIHTKKPLRWKAKRHRQKSRIVITGRR